MTVLWQREREREKEMQCVPLQNTLLSVAHTKKKTHNYAFRSEHQKLVNKTNRKMKEGRN